MSGESGALAHYKRFFTRKFQERSFRKEPLTVILSPHTDDVFLSLYETIISKQLGTNMLGVNVFTLYDTHARTSQQISFKKVTEVSMQNMMQEMNFSKELAKHGVSYLPIFLGLENSAMAQYYSFIVSRIANRSLTMVGLRSIANSAIDSMSSMKKAGSYVEDFLGLLLSQHSGEKLLLAPLGLGNHPDHLLLKHVAMKFAGSTRVGLYGDLPYMYQFKYLDREQVKREAPKGFSKARYKPFNAQTKARLFGRIYPNQGGSKLAALLSTGSDAVGEAIIWNR